MGATHAPHSPQQSPLLPSLIYWNHGIRIKQAKSRKLDELERRMDLRRILLKCVPPIAPCTGETCLWNGFTLPTFLINSMSSCKPFTNRCIKNRHHNKSRRRLRKSRAKTNDLCHWATAADTPPCIADKDLMMLSPLTILTWILSRISK